MANAAPEVRSDWPYKSAEVFTLPVQPRGTTPRRSIGLRAATCFPALVCEGEHAAPCRTVELSASGIVIERGRELSDREERSILKLELFLPGQERPIRVLARVVRRCGNSWAYALRFVAISDVDRLSLMEHLDREQSESLRLLDEIEHAGAA